MCGIAGLWRFGGGNGEALRVAAEAMASALRHRGPDDSGTWCDPAAGVGLGFRRLSILDLSSAGAQPMVSASGRYVLVFNGEIYNHLLLRARLGDGSFRGHSDSETILACVEAWGIERSLGEFVGMFAFALWDVQARTLTLVRDRAGVKPLYYASGADGVVFASELKAIPGDRRGGIDRGALSLYMRLGYVPVPWSIHEGVRKLAPGTMLTIRADGSSRCDAYWSAAREIEQAAAERFAGSDDEAADAVESLLAESVRLRLISDVPLGLFLSSGVDSSLVAAMMKREAGRVATFTIGLEGTRSEAPAAAAIARHLGTEHTEAIVGAAEAAGVVPKLAAMYDEPFGDSSAIPTFFVSRLARESVTVALSGDGGDELFGGYHRYFFGQKLAHRVGRVPPGMRRPAGRALRAASRLPMRRNFAERLRGMGSALVLDDPVAKYLQDVSAALPRVLAAPEREFVLTQRDSWPRLDDRIELMTWLDFVSYMGDGILTKVDRASMAVSLEVREPLLDHRLVRLAWSLPLGMKLRDGRGKWILRRVLSRYVPDSLIGHEKHGFGLPVERWLAGPLREWAASLLDPAALRRQGWIDPASAAKLWNGAPVAGNEGALWRLLVFQQWLQG